MSRRPNRRLVVKVGTNTLTNGADRLSRPVMLEVVRQIAQLLSGGDQVALVTSGAIVAGREALQVGRDARDIPFKQVLAAVGQVRLMHTWDQLFAHYGLTVAQTLLTRADLGDRQRYLNARNTLEARDTVQAQPAAVQQEGQTLRFTLPPISCGVVEIR